MRNCTINVKGADIAIASRHGQDYISITDMVKKFGDESIEGAHGANLRV